MLALTVLLLLSLATSLVAEDNWPRFRGPDGTGVAASGSPPSSWSTTENVAWAADVPGRGWSSPVVWDGKIFLTSVSSTEPPGAPKTGFYAGGPQSIPGGEHRWIVYAIDWETGRTLWEREVHRGHPDEARHLKNSYASETPVVDAERVYAYFGNLGAYAFDHDGKPAWSRPFEPVTTRNGWGTASSPVLHDGRLYIVNDNEDTSYLVALDAATGEPVWNVDRDEKSNWSSPFVWEYALRTEIVTTGASAVRAYDTDGNVLWSLSGMSTITIPTPFTENGLLFVSSGYMRDTLRPVYAIRPGASGDISLDEGQTSNGSIAWHLPQGGSYNTSPVVYDGRYYTLYDAGSSPATTPRPARRSTANSASTRPRGRSRRHRGPTMGRSFA